MYLETLLLVTVFSIVSISGSALHGPCKTNEDCGTIDTHCKNGVCACDENFTVWLDTCVSLPAPRVPCQKKHDCHTVLGVKTMCTKKLQCACKPFHHLHMGQCVKNKNLYETCEHDSQCYCGAGCEDNIGCIGKNCTCKPGNKPYKNRRCISESPMVSDTAVPVLSKMAYSANNENQIVPNSLTQIFFVMAILLLSKIYKLALV